MINGVNFPYALVVGNRKKYKTTPLQEYKGTSKSMSSIIDDWMWYTILANLPDWIKYSYLKKSNVLTVYDLKKILDWLDVDQKYQDRYYSR